MPREPDHRRDRGGGNVLLKLTTLAAVVLGVSLAGRESHHAAAATSAPLTHDTLATTMNPAESPRSRGIAGWIVGLGAMLVAVLLVGGAVQFTRAQQMVSTRAALLTGGDPAAGKLAIAHYSCGGCHDIPGVPGAEGMVGPPLTHFAGRVMIGGKYENTPDHLRLWLMYPQTMDPGIDMPNMGVTDREGRDMAAYLYSLK